MIARCSTSLFVLCSWIGFATLAGAQPVPPFSLQSDTGIEMPDGVVLAADVYVPASQDKCPAVLVRTPYDKGAFSWLAQPLAANGYAVVVQDVRGRGASKGEFEPFVHERADGLATLDWMARQAWSGGRVGLWGTSYPAYAGLVLAASGHQSIDTMVAMSGWGDVKDMLYPGGAFQLMVSLGWNLAPQIAGETGRALDWPSVFRMVPVNTIVPTLGGRRGSWGAVDRVLHDPAALRETSIRAGRLAIPILHITGWNDFLANETLAVFRQAEADALGGATGLQKLIVGPWKHDQIWTEETRVAGEDYGPAAKMGGRKVVELAIRWFDCFLKGRETGITREPRVRYFLMGANEWIGADSWPPRDSRPRAWFLDSNGHANTRRGDGTLGAQRPGRAGFDRFTFDPLDPVPTSGGANFHHFPGMLGPRDQRAVEERRDVLVYTSEPLTEDLHVAGPIEVELYASSDAPETDFTAKVVDVRGDGDARIIADGIRRIDPPPSPPSRPIVISLGDTAILLAKGSRLRLEVSSSNFPKYSRNPNTGENPEAATEFRKARQRLRHGGAAPSQLRMQVVPGDEPASLPGPHPGASRPS